MTPFDKLEKVTLLGESWTELVSENNRLLFYSLMVYHNIFYIFYRFHRGKEHFVAVLWKRDKG